MLFQIRKICCFFPSLPFETDTLYMYFNAYNSNTKKFNKDELLEKLKPSENELQNLKKNFALYLEIFKK